MSGKHRLKRHDLVKSLFFLFSQEYDSRKDESILDIHIPIEQVIRYLQEQFSVSYSGNQWIFTQIRNYEEEIGFRLFQKEKGQDNGIFLKICSNMEAFEQKRHLYVSQKIKVSNAIYDMIYNSFETKKNGPFRLLLGAGSTIFQFSEILAEKNGELPFELEIHTHNISVINCCLSPRISQDHLKVCIAGGNVNPVTNSIINFSEDLYADIEFDYIVQGASYLSGGQVFVESSEESEMKRKILKKCIGEKILVLTGHEVCPQQPVETAPFGNLTDFDYLVIPYSQNRVLKNLDQMLIKFEKILLPEILNWNYRIFRIRSG